MTSADLLKDICKALHAKAILTRDEDDEEVYELPISYIDSHPIELHRTPDGRVSDGAQTILRLQAQGRTESFQAWEILEQYLRVHRMAREGAELFFTGERDEILSFIQGLHDLEVVLPPVRDVSPRFDHVVRRKVEEALEAHAAASRLTDDDVERILHPAFTFTADLPDETTVHLEVKPDFMDRRQDHAFVILSHGTDSARARGSHIKDRLAEFYAARTSRPQSGRSTPVIHAVVPKDAYLEPDELTLIHLFTGNPPMPLASDDVRPLVDRLITDPQGPLTRY